MPLPSFLVATTPQPTEQVVTWIAVDHPQLDVVGLILGAFNAAGFLILAALGVGVLCGVTLILRRRREPELRPHLDLLER